MIKLYNIFYNGIYDGVEPYYEDTTDNFKNG